MKITGRALEAMKQREARAKAQERGGDVRAAVKAAVAPMVPLEPPRPLDDWTPVVAVPASVPRLAQGEFDKRVWQREYMREHRAGKRRRSKPREMVPQDIGLEDWL